MARISSHRDTDQIPISDYSVGRVKLNPAGSGKIDLAPSVRRTTAEIRGLVTTGNVKVSRNEPRGETQGSNGLHHQQSEVPARSLLGLQSLDRRLRAMFGSSPIKETFVDGVANCHQDVSCLDSPTSTDELLGPSLHLAAVVRKLSFDRTGKIRLFFRCITDRVGKSLLIYCEVRRGVGTVID